MMKKIFLSLVFVCLSFTAISAQTVAFTNVNVIPLNKEGVLPNQTVLIKNGVIAEISAHVKIPKNAQIVESKGKYLMPHLWDMHVHLHGDAQKLEKLAKAGILGIRDTGAFGQKELDFLKKQAASSNSLIPKIYYAGFIHNGKECEVAEHQRVDTLEELSKAIAFQKQNKIGFFKTHNCFPAFLAENLRQLSVRENIKIIGHIPQGLDAIEFVKLKVSSIEHTDIILRSLSFRKNNPAKSIGEAVKILEGDYLDDLAKAMVENKVALTPTLVTYENYVNNLPENQKSLGTALLKKLQQFTKRLADKGVLLLAGTDLGLPGIEPGKSLIREIELLIEAGLTIQEALKTATVNPAKYLGLKKLSLSKGGKADFIILNGNPLENIENLKDISIIVKNGKYKIITN